MTKGASAAGLAAAAVGSVAAFVTADLYAASLSSMEGAWASNLMTAACGIPGYVMAHGPLSTEAMPLLFGFIGLVAVWAAWSQAVLRAGTFRRGEEHGSASWMPPKEAARLFTDRKRRSNNIILTRNVGLAVDQGCLKPANRRAKNVLVVGGTGSGKTFDYVLPNALQFNQDMFFTDTKGDLSKKLGRAYERAGYDVAVFSTKEPRLSRQYNMLAYLETPADVIMFVRAFIAVTNGEAAKSEEAFWTDTTALLLMSTIGYLTFYCPDADRNLDGLITLLSLAQASEEDESFASPFELLMREVRDGTTLMRRTPEKPEGKRARRSFKAPSGGAFEWLPSAEPKAPEDDFSLLCWTLLKAAAGKTLKSVIVSTNSRLESMMVPEMRALTMRDEMGLDRFGEAGAKRVIFAVTSDTTDAFSFLMTMMVWQVVHLSTKKADERHAGSLPRPLHLMLDEFYNLGRLSEMDHVITTVRSRNISMSLLLQSVAQLKGRYGEHEAQIIVDNCDAVLYLGGKSTDTNKMISEMVGKQTIDMETYNITRGASGSTTRNRQLVERGHPADGGQRPRDGREVHGRPAPQLGRGRRPRRLQARPLRVAPAPRNPQAASKRRLLPRPRGQGHPSPAGRRGPRPLGGSMLANIISLVSGCVTFLGGFIVVWGAVSLGIAIRSETGAGGAQLAGAIATIAGGAIIIAAAVYFGQLDTSWMPS